MAQKLNSFWNLKCSYLHTVTRFTINITLFLIMEWQAILGRQQLIWLKLWLVLSSVDNPVTPCPKYLHACIIFLLSIYLTLNLQPCSLKVQLETADGHESLTCFSRSSLGTLPPDVSQRLGQLMGYLGHWWRWL